VATPPSPQNPRRPALPRSNLLSVIGQSKVTTATRDDFRRLLMECATLTLEQCCTQFPMFDREQIVKLYATLDSNPEFRSMIWLRGFMWFSTSPRHENLKSRAGVKDEISPWQENAIRALEEGF
jgi:hypothetical protein